jgi:hypothetical protein
LNFIDLLSSTALTRASPMRFLILSFRSILSPTPTRREFWGSGVDPSRNFLELVWLELADSELLIHAMPLRRKYFDLLPSGTDFDD